MNFYKKKLPAKFIHIMHHIKTSNEYFLLLTYFAFSLILKWLLLNPNTLLIKSSNPFFYKFEQTKQFKIILHFLFKIFELSIHIL